jgi:hypothetical protein
MASHATPLPAAKQTKPRRSAGKVPNLHSSTRVDSLHVALSIAEEKGLLKGGRTLMIRGRMPEELVAQAKRKTGITSDSKLLEAALANIVVADDYADWLFSQRGTINPALDLEF